MKRREFEAAAVFAVLVCGGLLCGCGVKPGIEDDAGGGNCQEREIRIRVATAVTRVADERFEDGDVLGLFVVNELGALASSGNHYDNEPLTFGGGALNSRELYYRDDRTVTDFYCYYPYAETLADVEAVPFGVNADQGDRDGYNGSDFLWGRTTGVMPSERLVNIPMRHLTSCLRVVLKPGAGWSAEELSGARVTVCGLKTAGFANLKDGSVEVGEAAAEIVAKNDGGGVFSAIVVPQSVTDHELVRIRLDTDEYLLKTSIDLLPGRVHTCEIIVSKTNGSFNATIGGWETDDNDYGGPVD